MKKFFVKAGPFVNPKYLQLQVELGLELELELALELELEPEQDLQIHNLVEILYPLPQRTKSKT